MELFDASPQDKDVVSECWHSATVFYRAVGEFRVGCDAAPGDSVLTTGIGDSIDGVPEFFVMKFPDNSQAK